MVQDSGGGGGSSGTYWYGIDVQVMWDWVNRDLSAHYDQASSWKKTSELAGLYGQRLQAFRERLAQTWKPETSKASEAFLTKLDELIVSVKNIDTVAGANYQAAVDIPNAISEAKYKLQPIYNSWMASETPEDATIKANEAAGVMYTLSSDLSSSRTVLGPPAPYKAPASPSKVDEGGDYGSGGSSSAGAPPMIPAVVPTPPPPPPPPPPGDFKPFPTPKGPDLVGLNPPPTPTPTPPITPSPTTPSPTGPVPPGPGVIKPPPPGTGPIRPTVPTAPIPAGGRPGMPPMVTPAGGAPPRGTQGLIGGTPPAGANRGPAGSRPNPVGGMINGPASGGGRGGVGGVAGGGGGVAGRGAGGGPGAAGRGGVGGAAGRGAMGAMGVGGRPGEQYDEEGEHFDPDTQWDVAQGVAPVLDTPDRQDDIDPGPAIGLTR